MREFFKLQRAILTVVSIFTVSLLIGCSSAETFQSQFGGKWEGTQGEGTVEINLGKDNVSMKINDKLYSATIDKVDKGNLTVYLKVETTAGQTEDWTLRQIWDDNGSSFKIAFNHNGTKEILKART
jgi:hypothetical protein